jgi:hypothetical protein
MKILPNQLLAGCAERQQRTRLHYLKFPDLRENTGNFRRKAPPRLLKPIETRDFFAEFPAIGTGNFLFQTGKTIALTAN